ncbi:MAG: TonB-dependent receptor [Microscillaceae bacterium]|nr:TonB-dependent receptor [Microscillaceae bacterium]
MEEAYDFGAGVQSLVQFNGVPEDVFLDFGGWIGPGLNDFGLFARVVPNLGSYEASEQVTAGYLMADFRLAPKFKVSTGIRFERTDIALEMRDAFIAPELRFADLERNDFLPGINTTWNIKENMNLRASYGRTIARPTFRELARFTTFDFLGDFTLIGNPFLERTVVDNIDLRWEIFPRTEEIFSLSLFYKSFQDPIERAVNPTTSDLAIQFEFRNVEQAFVLGGELEIRKKLDFISPTLKNLSVGANITVLTSQVDIAPGELALIRVNDPAAESTRPLFGQSPYIINALLSYNNLDNGWAANLSFNVQGERLSAVSVGGTPNVFEQPRPMLDFNVSKTLGNFKIKFSAGNLLNAKYKFTQDFNNTEYIYQLYQLGQTFGLSLSYGLER